MIIIKLIRRKNDNLYYPVTYEDRLLMQHCLNEDLSAINNNGVIKARYIADAHGWEIEIREHQ